MNLEDEGNFLVSLLERHPLSKLCGDMPTLEFDELAADIFEARRAHAYRNVRGQGA